MAEDQGEKEVVPRFKCSDELILFLTFSNELDTMLKVLQDVDKEVQWCTGDRRWDGRRSSWRIQSRYSAVNEEESSMESGSMESD